VTRDPRPWIAALRRSHERLTLVVEPLGTDAVDAPSMATGWSVAQVMSHLGSQAEIFAGILDAAREGRPLPGPEAFPAVWDKWNALSPEDQVSASLAANEAFVVETESLTDAQLGELRFAMFGMDLDMTGFLRMRLSEHALHSWDVIASLDPTASVSPDAVDLLIDTLPELASRVGKPQDQPVAVRIVTTDPARDLRLTVDEAVSIEPFDGGSSDGVLRLPAETFVRLVYGRLEDGDAPSIEGDGDGVTLDLLRSVFPGF
jgi:uncharacterized protein (TIGR03083 family)